MKLFKFVHPFTKFKASVKTQSILIKCQEPEDSFYVNVRVSSRDDLTDFTTDSYQRDERELTDFSMTVLMNYFPNFNAFMAIGCTEC